MSRGAGHRREEHRERREEAWAGPVEDLQSGEHLPGAGGEPGVDSGKPAEHEGEEARDKDAVERRRSVHTREREPGLPRFLLQAHDRPPQRAPEVREVVRGLLRAPAEAQKGISS